MAGVGRVLRRAGLAAVAASALMLVSCENALLDYLFKGILYNGWKVATWSAPAPVVDGFTHLAGQSNGYPMNMIMTTGGKLHLVGWFVNEKVWGHATMPSGSSRFAQSFAKFGAIVNAALEELQPGMEVISDDWLLLTYADTANKLYYQQFYSGSGWGAQEVLYTAAGAIGRTFTYNVLVGSVLKTHVFFVSSGVLYHAERTGPSAITGPDVFVSGVGDVRAVRRNSADIDFVWSDAAGQHLSHRTFADSTVRTIWTNPNPAREIGEIALDNDSSGKLHVVFGTYDPAATTDVSAATLHYTTNAGGAWQERQSITGTASEGPLAFLFPASLDVAPDKNGNMHPHLAFAMYRPPMACSIWYAYWDEAGWHLSEGSLDTVNGSLWTFPVMLVDGKGIVHITYSWSPADNDRTMMYVRGTPAELQQ